MKKNFLKLIFTAISLIVMSSQNQTVIGIENALENLITTDKRGLVEAFSSIAYDDIVERHNNLRGRNLLQHQRRGHILNYCPANGTDSSPLPEVPLLDSLAQSIRDTACKCVAWGNCPKSVCACNKLCPNNFDIFKRKPREGAIQSLTTKENSLSFRNTSSAFQDNKMTNGYCWGHAAMTTKFNRLADFKEDDKRMLNMLSSPNRRFRAQARDYYKKIIHDISNNKVKTIPGFKNLYEFSKNPTIQRLIATQITDEWGENAMTFSGLGVALSSGKMSKKKSEEFMVDVLHKLGHSQQPQIVFTQRGERFATHTVLVSHFIRENGKIIFCIRDNNYSPESNRACRNRMTMGDDGGMEYRGEKLGKAMVAHNDDEDALAQFNNLRYDCLSKRGCI